jgi:hypothetical protein
MFFIKKVITDMTSVVTFLLKNIILIKNVGWVQQTVLIISQDSIIHLSFSIKRKRGDIHPSPLSLLLLKKPISKVKVYFVFVFNFFSIEICFFNNKRKRGDG